MTYISLNLSTEPVQMYETNYPYAGTSDGNWENIGVYGSEGSDGPGPVGGIDVFMFLIINQINILSNCDLYIRQFINRTCTNI